MALVSAMPELPKIAGDLIIRQMDWPGANDLADRVAMAIPFAQIDKELPDNIDPKAKQMLAQAMGQVQQLKQQLDALQREKDAKVFGVQVKEQAITQRQALIENAETHRLHMKALGQDERANLVAQTKVHDTQVKADTSMNQTLIDATTNLEIERRQAMQSGVSGVHTTSGGSSDPSPGGVHMPQMADMAKQMAALTAMVEKLNRPKKRTLIRGKDGKAVGMIEE
jgi:hypothetical protein